MYKEGAVVMFSQLQKAQIHLFPPLIMPNGQKIVRLEVEKEDSDSYDKYSVQKPGSLVLI